MKKLFSSCSGHLDTNGSEAIRRPLQLLVHVMHARFGICLDTEGKMKGYTDDDSSICSSSEEDGDIVLSSANLDAVAESKVNNNEALMGLAYNSNHLLPDDDEDMEGDGPVIVPSEEIEESLARSALVLACAAKHSASRCILDKELELKYPLLFAAMTPQEDIIMTCARLLDTAPDVSLVREAATYLEEVEAKYRASPTFLSAAELDC